MRKNKFFIIGTIVVSLLVFSVVQAGYLFDYGELEGHPGAKEANWMAWWLTDSNRRPAEILTEDNTNCIDGVDIGYSDIYDIGLEIEPEDGNLEWILQVENFSSMPIPGVLDDVNMLFGGLGSFSGTLWHTKFDWTNTEPYSDHDLISSLEGEYPACPFFYEPTDSDPTTYSFYSTQPGTYLVYRSQNASGAFNGASNGRYFYFTTVTTTTGYGTFTDTSPGPNWYIVFQVDNNNIPIGCHSEPADPTGIRIVDFTAEFDLSEKVIVLSWEKVMDDILGFNLYRSKSEQNKGEMINDEMISMDQETFVDADLELGETYYYWLEVVGLDGGREDIGPRLERAGYLFFMPVIQD